MRVKRIKRKYIDDDFTVLSALMSLLTPIELGDG